MKKVRFVISVSKAVVEDFGISANDIVKEICKEYGGNGGGNDYCAAGGWKINGDILMTNKLYTIKRPAHPDTGHKGKSKRFFKTKGRKIARQFLKQLLRKEEGKV